MSLRMLADDRRIRGVRDAFGKEVAIVDGVAPDGLRALNEWPSGSEVAAILPDLLRALAANAETEEERGLLTRAADVAQDVASATIAALLAEVIGLR